MSEKVKRSIVKNTLVCGVYMVLIWIATHFIKIPMVNYILALISGLLMSYYFVKYKVTDSSDTEKSSLNKFKAFYCFLIFMLAVASIVAVLGY